MPESIAVIKKSQIARNEDIRDITYKAMTYTGTCAAIDSTCSSISENPDGIMVAIKSYEISITHRHAIGQVQVAGGGKISKTSFTNSNSPKSCGGK